MGLFDHGGNGMTTFVRAALVAAAAAVIIGGCTAGMSTRQATTASLDDILAGEQRSPENRLRDQYRHPKETLLFFGLRPEMQVIEIWPEPSGWYTEVIAPLVREKGRYYAAVGDPAPGNAYQAKSLAEFRQKLAERPGVYDKVDITPFPSDGGDIVPPGTVDMVVTFRNVHNWMARDNAPQAFKAMYRALKPGGVLGVVEHRGNASMPQDPKAKSGYVNEQFAIDLIEAQGFRLVAKSEINANPRDTKDYEQGVWTLPPVYRLGDKDREKYRAIGESDRFTLKFVKPARAG
ncbi:MAG TPA: methyltransferase domain-containing protein [Steroidobacteraceae bacterium]|nr:methyltransferase domain-containing protein [Steroidobacteraceae bacterium]